ncbi:hypothetical protein GGR56DRAFT_676063 [Xylariaceae sp. FL0804]|nr:hypothetical protein GGR56DRAFT_676063 [Xylariaceae sp. FL0804]
MDHFNEIDQAGGMAESLAHVSISVHQNDNGEGGSVHHQQQDPPPPRPPQSFPLFPRLPPELRVMIYLMAAEAAEQSEDPRPVRTLGVHGTGLAVLTERPAALLPPAARLWRAAPDFRDAARALRLYAELPARRVTRAAATIIYLNSGRTGLRPARTRRLSAGSDVGGAWPLRADRTTFFVPEGAALRLFNDLYYHPVHGRDDEDEDDSRSVWSHGPPPLQLPPPTWLRRLMLDRRTFLHALGSWGARRRRDGDDGGDGVMMMPAGAPFVGLGLLPGLRTLVVAFTRRFREVDTIEGPWDEVFEEVAVVPTVVDAGDDEEAAAEEETRRDVVVRVRFTPTHVFREVDPDTATVVLGTVYETRDEVAALRAAGVDVVWGLVESLDSRRRDLFDGFEGL